MRVGVLSDTHIGPGGDTVGLEAAVRRHFAGIDTILHAGDLTSLERLETALHDFHLICVAGNMDDAVTVSRLPLRRELSVGGKRIGLIHGWGEPSAVPARVLAEFPGADCVVFGHTHRPQCEERGGVLLFNPGSPTDRRFAPRRSLGVLEIGDKITATLIELDE
jgi:uncharacterized protein